MSRSCQSATFSSPTVACCPDDPGQPADPLGDDRVALVRHRRRALLAGAERLLRPRAPRCGRGGGSRARSVRARTRRGRAWTGAPHAGREARSASRPAPARDRGARRRSARARDRSRNTCRRLPRASRPASRRAPARTRARSRSSSNAQPASFSPNVVGSACTPCVRPMQSVRTVLLGAGRDDRESPGRAPRAAARLRPEPGARAPVSTTSDEVRP